VVFLSFFGGCLKNYQSNEKTFLKSVTIDIFPNFYVSRKNIKTEISASPRSSYETYCILGYDTV
jgi:hypothetical protein